MRNYIGRILSVAAVIILGICLAGCGKKKDDIQRDPYKYVANFTDIPVDLKDSYMSGMVVDGDTIYGIVTKFNKDTYDAEEVSLRMINITTGESKSVPMDLKAFKDGYLSSMVKTSDGLVALYSVWNDQMMINDYSLYSIKENGKMEFLFSLSDFLSENDYVNKLLCDKDGDYIICSEQSIIKIGKDGAEKGRYSSDEWLNLVFFDGDGNICTTLYSMSAGKYEVRKVDLKKGTLGDTLPFSIMDGEVQYVNGKYLIINSNTVKECDPATGETKDLWTWINVDTNYTTGLSQIQIGEDGSYNFVHETYSLDGDYGIEKVSIKRVETGAEGDKIELVLGCLDLDWDFKEYLLDFNKKSDKYHITVKIYGDDTDYDAAKARFDADMASGKLFDIVITDQSTGMNLAKKGAFADLGKIMSKDDEIKRSDFFENILDCMQVKGKDYLFVPRAGVVTMAGPASYFTDNSSWTLKDLLELRKQNPDASFIEYPSMDYALSMLLRYNLTDFVDINKGKCSFNSQEFKDVLEFVKTFPKEIDYSNYNSWAEIRTGDVYCATVSVSDFSELSLYDQLLPGGAKLIGIPSENGAKNIVYANTVYAITAKSGYSEGAWEFFKFLLSDEVYNARDFGGLPTYKKAFDNYVEKVLEIGDQVVGGWGNGEEMIDIYNPSREQIEKVKAIYETANSSVIMDDKIFEIIDEEVKPFLEGQKSAEEVADILQSRIGIYLAENG